MRKLFGIVFALLMVCGWAAAGEKLTASPLFSDNMVLQREIAVPVWGEAMPGTEVSVTFAGQTKTAKADDKGMWKVALDPLKAEKNPAQMQIKAGQEIVAVNNVLVGEVWIASGQSNMDCPMSFFKNNAGKESPQIAKEMAAADFPEIRQFEVAKPKSEMLKESCKAPFTTLSGKWVVCKPDTVGGYSGTGFFFARALYAKLGIPVGLIKNAWGGMPVEAYMSREALEALPYGKTHIANKEKAQTEYSKEKADAAFKAAMLKWEELKKKADAEGKPVPHKPRFQTEPVATPNYPTTLYNSLVHPLLPYAIRGVIWYQGEANAGNKAYYETFPAMITDWRKAWGQGDFPFYFVQLANYMAVNEQPAESGWALLRDAQLATLKLPNTGMAVIIDIGEAKDIHPRNKISVGERLAQWALAKDYKQGVPVFSGPLFKSVSFTGGKAVVTFDSVGSGLAAGQRADVWTEPVLDKDEPARFQICGADKKWVWAKAKITGKDTVEVSAEGVTEPVAVRYAWMNNPGEVPLLYNKEALPASPFRTDSF